jgi:hypothetical protein
MIWTNLWKRYFTSEESNPVVSNSNRPLEGLVRLVDLPPSTLQSLEYLLRPNYPLANLFQSEVQRLKTTANNVIRSSPRNIGDFVTREQSIGAVDQVEHFEKFFVSLHFAVLAEVKRREATHKTPSI